MTWKKMMFGLPLNVSALFICLMNFAIELWLLTNQLTRQAVCATEIGDPSTAHLGRGLGDCDGCRTEQADPPISRGLGAARHPSASSSMWRTNHQPDSLSVVAEMPMGVQKTKKGAFKSTVVDSWLTKSDT
jgi:hypothetical protein